MKNWIRRKLHDFIFSDREADSPSRLVSSSDELGYQDDNSIRFQVTSARGGLILSMRYYNSRTDQNQYQNYVIPDDQDAAEEIAKIVSMELLRSPS